MENKTIIDLEEHIKLRMHILLTRPLEDSKDLIMRFKALGHQVSHLPVITIKKKTKGVIYVEDLLKAIIKSLFNKRPNQSNTELFISNLNQGCINV